MRYYNVNDCLLDAGPFINSKECKEKKYVNLSYFLILKLLGKKPCSEEVRFQSI